MLAEQRLIKCDAQNVNMDLNRVSRIKRLVPDNGILLEG